MTNIYAVTVTYGNRFQYLKKVVKSLLNQNIDRIIIVSNGVEKASLTAIKKLQNKENKIDLIFLDKNTGSANGFYTGISHALKKGADYIWLLDDDNKPLQKSLDVLKKEWKVCIKNKTRNKLALLSYRKDRQQFSDAVDFANPKLMLGSQNSFLGFDVFSFFKNKKMIKQKKEKGIVAVAPYGGLMFHKDLIKEIGLPNRNFFLYGDDYDFSYRITKKKGLIYLIKNSKIEDLETSFHLKKTGEKFQTRFFKTNSKEKIFYSVRNGIIFEQNFVTNRIKYRINASIYMALLLFIMLLNPKHLWKYYIVINGVTASTQKLKDDI